MMHQETNGCSSKDYVLWLLLSRKRMPLLSLLLQLLLQFLERKWQEINQKVLHYITQRKTLNSWPTKSPDLGTFPRRPLTSRVVSALPSSKNNKTLPPSLSPSCWHQTFFVWVDGSGADCLVSKIVSPYQTKDTVGRPRTRRPDRSGTWPDTSDRAWPSMKKKKSDFWADEASAYLPRWFQKNQNTEL